MSAQLFMFPLPRKSHVAPLAANDNFLRYVPPLSVTFYSGDRNHAYLYQTCGGETATLCGLHYPNNRLGYRRTPREVNCLNCLDAADTRADASLHLGADYHGHLRELNYPLAAD
jgi:hypothetical protein